MVVESFCPTRPRSGCSSLISAVALALDWVDGQVARRTHTESAFGARFDMEVDAFLILVLSVVRRPRRSGAWVLAIGLARYLLLAAEQVLPWLRRPTPPRYWGKVVAALQGIVLTVAAAGVLPTLLDRAAARGRAGPARRVLRPPGVVAVAHAATARSLDARFTAPPDPGAPCVLRLGGADPAQPGRRTSARWPSSGSRSRSLVLVALAALLPHARLRNLAAVVVGVLLALVMIAKTLDMGFYFALNRSFDPVIDWTLRRLAVGLLRDSLSTPASIALLRWRRWCSSPCSC